MQRHKENYGQIMTISQEIRYNYFNIGELKATIMFKK